MYVEGVGDVRLFVMDVDGTLTDGKIYMGNAGELLKAFSVKDGLGIKKLQKMGVEFVIITGRVSDIVMNRAKELGITKIYQGIDNKISKLREVCIDFSCTLDNVVYIGDDENDLECMQACGHCACTNDAWSSVREKADFISSFNGGEGAVRDYIEYLIKHMQLN